MFNYKNAPWLPDFLITDQKFPMNYLWYTPKALVIEKLEFLAIHTFPTILILIQPYILVNNKKVIVADKFFLC